MCHHMSRWFGAIIFNVAYSLHVGPPGDLEHGGFPCVQLTLLALGLVLHGQAGRIAAKSLACGS